MLNKYQFEVLKSCLIGEAITQRDIAAATGVSLGSVNKALHELIEQGLLGADHKLTAKGKDVLNAYKVDNAIILAAGPATRFAPLSFEKPKAMFEVRGEILIERLIRQLKEAGISDITIVVGYMKEVFFYLEDEFDVHIVVNPQYAARNNNASLWAVKERLANTYVLSSDQYYSQNIFSLYNFGPYFTATYSEGPTKEQVVELDSKNRIIDTKKGGTDSYYIQGPAYFDHAFSQRYVEILDEVYDRPETKEKLWEDIFADHVDELPMVIRPVGQDVIHEFDCLTDLTAFDHDFFTNVDSRILDNICRTLKCTRDDITEVVPVKAGLTNLSVLFSAKGIKYIYRHPGNGTEEIVNREAEAFALQAARDLGLDDTFIYEEPKEGWKISRYVEGAFELDYKDGTQVEKALQMAYQLHHSGIVSPWSFDFYSEGIHIAQMLREMGYPLPREFDTLAARIEKIAKAMKPEAGEPVLCHNDFYGPNFLVTPDRMRLIDWEYAAMGDAACDIGNFVAQGSGYTPEKTLEILPLYYGREATEVEQRHCLAAVSVVGWYWYVWAMYKEAMGNPMAEWLYIWYRAAKDYAAAAETRYGLENEA